MRHVLISFSCFLFFSFTHAQNAQAIITELQTINQSVAAKPCNTDSAAAISNRAMSVFLAAKTGYLSASSDLSYYTNYVTFSTADARFTVNHNFQQPSTGDDARIKKMLGLGFDVSIPNNYAKSFLDKRFEPEMGITVNYKWLGKVTTRFADCTPANNARQKQAIDALRAGLLAQIQAELTKKEMEFDQALLTIDATTVPGQDPVRAKKTMAQNFYEDLKAAYEEKFAVEQAALLFKTNNFTLIRTHWTSISAYIPVFVSTYSNANSLTAAFSEKHPYPLSLLLGHTRLWEGPGFGRLFFTLNGGLLLNNSKLSYGLTKINYSEYKNLGGTGLTNTSDPGNNKLYIGAYKNFITPSVSARLQYFPSNSHAGLSFLAEQNFGQYNFLNCRLAVPVVLINAKKIPAVNIECYVLFIDITNRVAGIGKTTAGLSLGIPFSRLMY